MNIIRLTDEVKKKHIELSREFALVEANKQVCKIWGTEGKANKVAAMGSPNIEKRVHRNTYELRWYHVNLRP